MGEQTKITLREVPKQIPLNDISENPQNPRKYFDEIQELAENIKAVGLLQPKSQNDAVDDNDSGDETDIAEDEKMQTDEEETREENDEHQVF